MARGPQISMSTSTRTGAALNGETRMKMRMATCACARPGAEMKATGVAHGPMRDEASRAAVAACAAHPRRGVDN